MNFLDWLLAQIDRNDPVGDVARAVRDDRASCPRPTKARNHRGIRWHMVPANQACAEALDAIDQAYAEYCAAYPRHTAC